jgi:hypothetical protein
VTTTPAVAPGIGRMIQSLAEQSRADHIADSLPANLKVPPSGPMDRAAFVVANRLVGCIKGCSGGRL